MNELQLMLAHALAKARPFTPVYGINSRIGTKEQVLQTLWYSVVGNIADVLQQDDNFNRMVFVQTCEEWK